MKRALKIGLLGLLALLLLFIGAAVWMVNDEALLRRQLESRISASLQREFTIDGLDLDLGMISEVRLQGVGLANAEWGSANQLVHIGKLSAFVDLSHLFTTGIEIQQLEIADAQLNLEENDIGEVNWVMGGDGGETEDGETETLVPWKQIHLSQFELTHSAPDREVPLEFRIEDFQADQSANGRVGLRGQGVIGGYELSVDGFVDPLAALLAGGRFSHRVTVDIGHNRLSSEGIVDDFFTGAGARIDMQLSGPQFEWLLQQAALPQFSTGPFDASLQLRVADDESLKLDIDGDLGSFQASATGTLDKLVQPSRLGLEFEFSGPDLEALAETLGIANLPALPYRTEGRMSAVQGATAIDRFEAHIGGDTFTASGTLGPWPHMEGTTLDVEASGADVSVWGPSMGFEHWRSIPYTLDGTLKEQGGLLSLGNTLVTVGDGRIKLDGTLGKPPDMVGAAINLDLEVPDLSQVLLLRALGQMPQLPANLEGNLRRDANGIHLNGFLLSIAQHSLATTALIALNAGAGDLASAPWQARLVGSRLETRLTTPSARALAESFGLGAWPEQPLELTMDVSLEQDGLRFTISDGNLGDLHAGVQGILPRPPGLDGANATFDIQLPSIRLIESFATTPELPELPGQVSGSARKSGDGYTFEDVEGSLGQSRFNLNGEVVLSPEFRVRQARFAASGPNFREFLDHEALLGLPAKFEISGDLDVGGASRQIRQLALTLGKAELGVSGTVDQLPLPESFDLEVKLADPDVSELEPFLRRFGDYLLPEDALDLGFSLSGTRQAMNISAIQASLGRSDLAGQFSISPGEVPEIRGTIDSELIDLSWLREADVESGQADNGASPTVDAPDPAGRSAQPARVFSDQRLPLLSFDPILIDFSFKAAEIDLPLTRLAKVNLNLKLSEDEILLNLLGLEGVGGGRLEGTFSAKPGADVVTISVKGTADGLRLGLAAAERQDISTYPPADILVDIQATGGSPHELASTANGKIGLIMGQGKLLNSRLDLLFSDLLSELFSALNPFVKKSEYTELECAVARITITDGVAQVDPQILQTREIAATSSGKIDLATEKIDLAFNTRPRKGIGISPGMVINPFIKMGGTLARPAITLDATGAAVSGGAAVATAGLSLLGKSLYDRFLTEKDPCGKVAAELRKMYENDDADS